MANMMDEKYRGRYKGGSDWIGKVINDQCVVTDDEGKNPKLDLDKLFALAEVNGLSVENHRATADQTNAPGRLRMTIGNMLRGKAKKRHGLYAIDKTELVPDSDFAVNPERSEDLDGNELETESKRKKREEKEAKAAEVAKKKADKEAAKKADKEAA